MLLNSEQMDIEGAILLISTLILHNFVGRWFDVIFIAKWTWIFTVFGQFIRGKSVT